MMIKRLAFLFLGGQFFLSAAHAFPECTDPLAGGGYYLAASSEERGYVEDDPLFNKMITDTVQARALALCQLLTPCSDWADYEVEEIKQKAPIRAKVVRTVKLPPLVFSRVNGKMDPTDALALISPDKIPPSEAIVEREYEKVKPWYFGNDGHKNVGSSMWYTGKAIALASPAGLLAGPAAVIVTPVLAGTGTLVSALSRAVERTPFEITAEHALERLAKKKKINKVSKWFGHRTPHLVFKKITCFAL